MKKLLFVLCLFSGYYGSTQDHSVDLSTGTLNVVIPLTTIQDGDISMPVSLNYSGNGVRVAEAGGIVGHKWSLSVDAGISREVRSLPDDYLGTGTDTRVGWLHGDMGTRIKNFTINTDNNASTCSDEAVNYDFLNGFGYNEDTEPDIYYVNVPGLSFRFYFDENKLRQVVPHQDVEISYTTDPITNQISSFTIVDGKGFIYAFQAIEKTKEWIKESSVLKDYAMKRRYELYKTPCTYATAWKLTRITSPVHGQIDFQYEDVTLISDPTINEAVSIPRALRQGQYVFRNSLSVMTDWNSKHDIMVYGLVYYQKVLQKITTPSADIVFERFVKLDKTEVLKNIKIYEKRLPTPLLVKDYEFTYQGPMYFAPDPNDPYGTNPNPYFPGMILVGTRSYLVGLKEKVSSLSMPPFSFEYYGLIGNGVTTFPAPASEEKDEWGFYTSEALSYQETLEMGTLKKMQYPTGGYKAFFYEPHQYFDITTSASVRGGGIRVRKIITHDGISPLSDITELFEYKREDGQSSGKLVSKPLSTLSAVRLNEIKYRNAQGSLVTMSNARYSEVQQQVNNGTIPGNAAQYFKLKAMEPLAIKEQVNGSMVAYERVITRHKGAGRSIYEFDLPAMTPDVSANDGEWEASTVAIARPSTGSGACYETGAIATGINQFPYPSDPNYGFARGLLKKVTDENEQGIIVRDVVKEYKRVYGESAIRKIYGLSLEELPSYFHNGSSYIDGKMFLFSKYAVFTNVKTVLEKQTETFYHSPDLTEKTETVTTYGYDSPHHRGLTSIKIRNSDETETVTKFTYVKDYVITSPADPESQALKKLHTAHRNELVESTSSVLSGGTEEYTEGSLHLFQEIGNKIYPYKDLAFKATDGSTSFVPSGIVGGNDFHHDETSYRLVNTFLSFTNTGNVKEQVGEDRKINATVWGYNGTLPVFVVTNARINEIGYSDFETITEVDFSSWPDPTFVIGRTGEKALVMPGGDAFSLSRNVVNSGTQQYIFSCWVKAPENGMVTLKIKNGTTDLIPAIQLPYTGSATWKYLSLPVNSSALPVNFTVTFSSTTPVEIDDVSYYPSHADITSYTYVLPHGKGSETNGRGQSLLYTYDEWGRITIVRDQDGNILKKYDYHVKP